MRFAGAVAAVLVLGMGGWTGALAEGVDPRDDCEAAVAELAARLEALPEDTPADVVLSLVAGTVQASCGPSSTSSGDCFELPMPTSSPIQMCSGDDGVQPPNPCAPNLVLSTPCEPGPVDPPTPPCVSCLAAPSPPPLPCNVAAALLDCVPQPPGNLPDVPDDPCSLWCPPPGPCGAVFCVPPPPPVGPLPGVPQDLVGALVDALPCNPVACFVPPEPGPGPCGEESCIGPIPSPCGDGSIADCLDDRPCADSTAECIPDDDTLPEGPCDAETGCTLPNPCELVPCTPPSPCEVAPCEVPEVPGHPCTWDGMQCHPCVETPLACEIDIPFDVCSGGAGVGEFVWSLEVAGVTSIGRHEGARGQWEATGEAFIDGELASQSATEHSGTFHLGKVLALATTTTLFQAECGMASVEIGGMTVRKYTGCELDVWSHHTLAPDTYIVSKQRLINPLCDE